MWVTEKLIIISYFFKFYGDVRTHHSSDSLIYLDLTALKKRLVWSLPTSHSSLSASQPFIKYKRQMQLKLSPRCYIYILLCIKMLLISCLCLTFKLLLIYIYTVYIVPIKHIDILYFSFKLMVRCIQMFEWCCNLYQASISVD